MKKNEFKMREALERMQEIKGRLREMAENLASDNNREDYTDAEKAEQRELGKESAILEMQIRAAQAPIVLTPEQKQTINENFREIMQKAKMENNKREISLGALTEGAKNNIESSGAITLRIQDLLPELNEGLVWDKVGMKVQYGVEGTLLWPYATDGAVYEEVGETQALTDQKIDFANIQPEAKSGGVYITISNEAIDDAAFDILAYVQKAMSLAVARYLCWKTFSTGTGFTGIKGPWANKASIPELQATYENILNAKADMINSGIDMNGFCYVLDAKAEALLKATPKADGQGGFIIQNGLLDGDPYVVTHYIRSTRTAAGASDTRDKQGKANGKDVLSNDMYIGFGVWSNCAPNQHGKVRFVIDPITLSEKNVTKVTLNTRWSLTTLREEAFAVYKLVKPAAKSAE